MLPCGHWHCVVVGTQQPEGQYMHGNVICTGLYIFILPFKSKSYHLQDSLLILLSIFFFLSCSFFEFKTVYQITELLSNFNYALSCFTLNNVVYRVPHCLF